MHTRVVQTGHSGAEKRDGGWESMTLAGTPEPPLRSRDRWKSKFWAVYHSKSSELIILNSDRVWRRHPLEGT